MQNSLKGSKVVLFGAGRNGKLLLEKLIRYGATPAYFADNNNEIPNVEYTDNLGVLCTLVVKAPDALLGEDKSTLKIIITPGAPYHMEIESQVKEMGLGECLYKMTFDYHWMYNSLLSEINTSLERVAQAIPSLGRIADTVSPKKYYTNIPERTALRETRNFYEYLDRKDFEEKYLSLIDGLDADSICTLNQILGRMQKVRYTNLPVDIYTPEEQKLMHELRESYLNQRFRITDTLFSYKNYLLPDTHYDVSVFWEEHGIRHIRNISAINNKDIIDAGAFDGDSALVLSPLTRKKVYSFEPVKENYELMLRTLRLNKVQNVVAVNCGLGAHKGEYVMNIDGPRSTVASTADMPDKNDAISVVSLDDYADENNLEVGLIKTDVEGFEQELLKGARKTIKKFKPVLLISIYHSPSDFFEIKPMIKNWDVGYNFKIFKPFDGSIESETLLIAEV